MKYNIKKNWLSSFETIAKHPVILMPFIIIAFFEALVLQVAFFSVRFPLSAVLGPVISKFFGPQFLHYPANLILLPNLFYYGQIFIYVTLGVFLTAMAVDSFRMVKSSMTVKPRVLITNALRRYVAFFIYGIIVVTLLTLMRRADTIFLTRVAGFLSRRITALPRVFYTSMFLAGHFISHIILQVFLIMVIPIMVLQKKPLHKAFLRSVILGFRRFFTVFVLIFVPFLLYLPIMVLRADPVQLINRTFPEATLFVTFLAILIAPLVDCFMITSVAQLVADNTKDAEKTK